MASMILHTLLILSVLFLSNIQSLINASSSDSTNSTYSTNFSSLKSPSTSTLHSDHCSKVQKRLIKTLQSALSQGHKLSNLLSAAHGYNLTQKRKGTWKDCMELHQISLSVLQTSISLIQSCQNIYDVRGFLSAALTNRATCLEGLRTAAGRLKLQLVGSLATTYTNVSNALSMLTESGLASLGSSLWLSRGALQALQISSKEFNTSKAVTVSQDGCGDFTTVSQAIDFAPNNSAEKVFIYVKKGIYYENVEIPSWKTNIVLLGDGSDVTIITGNRSAASGWTTFRSATLAVSAQGFLARDLTIENTAGPNGFQAVALRINADQVAIYRCTISGYQDTLYAHSFQQFYRECHILGTIDYILGNAAVVFQGCNIISRMPLPGQSTVITAQSRDSPDEPTGISIQNCSILATDDLYSNLTLVKNYLGRPWRNYSRTVILESYIDDFIDPAGWTNWIEDWYLDTLYFGEYGNYGPGACSDGHVTWRGYHVMNYSDASNFTVTPFIAGKEWLYATTFPYDDGLESIS